MDPLASIGELENHLQREMDPDVAAQALQLASGAVRAYCKWDLSYEAAATLSAEGTGTVVLSVPTLNLLNVTSVRVDGLAIDLDPTLLSWSKTGQLYRPYGWPQWSGVEIDCEHGYDPIPDVLKLVTLDLAGQSLNNPEGLVSATVGPVSKTYASGGGDIRMSALHERLLHRYSL